MSSWLPGLLGAVLAAALLALSNRMQKPARKNAGGWKVLRPGWLVNAAMLGLAAIATLAAYILLVGSSLPDAATQERFAAMLMLGCGSASLYYLWTGYGRTILWKGNELRVRTIFGREQVRRISDLSRVGRNEMLDEYILTFKEGSGLRVSAQFHGTRDLVKRLPKRAQD